MATTSGRRVVIPMTNKSGGSVAAGDVVIIDTANDTAFTTTTSARSELSIGVAQETIANNATGKVLTAGYAALINVPASVTRGHYIETHTVAKQATGSATRRSGSFGQFLTGGTTPTGWLWGQTDQTATASGVTPPQAVTDPTSFDGLDTINGSSTTPFADVDAFTTKEVLNSRVLHLVTKGASQDDRVRVTLNTTKAGVFDIRTRVSFFGLYWSAGTGDAYLEIMGSTSGGSQLFIARVIPVNLNNSGTSPFGRTQKLRVGHTAITSVDANVEPIFSIGEELTLRIQRDGSNVLSFSYGLGAYPLALGPIITSSEVAYAPTSSGTLARIEYSIHTPSGPGASAEWHCYLDYLTNN